MRYMEDLVKMAISINFRDIKVKYTHSGVKSSMLAMDKEISKKSFKK